MKRSGRLASFRHLRTIELDADTTRGRVEAGVEAWI
jgi:hypothetical protein